jgi:N-acetylmuramic acid 6-phosphate (MurNAc-6-P) etherase
VLAHFALKLVLNAITTCANVIRGAVHGNSMINLTVSNNKLFHRAAEIVASLAHCTVERAHRTSQHYDVGMFAWWPLFG